MGYDAKLGDAAQENIRYALKNMNTKTITRTLSNNSDSVPSTGTVYFDGLAKKIYCDFTIGQDADVVKFMPPFKLKVVDVTVRCDKSVANGGIIINNGSGAMTAEIACITAGTVARVATSFSRTLAEVESTEYIKIIGVSSGLEGTVIFDVIQA